MKFKRKVDIEITAGSNMQSETFDEFLDAVLKVRESRHKHNKVESISSSDWVEAKKFIK